MSFIILRKSSILPLLSITFAIISKGIKFSKDISVTNEQLTDKLIYLDYYASTDSQTRAYPLYVHSGNQFN